MSDKKPLKQKMENLNLETIAGRLAFITKEAGVSTRKIRSTMAKICDVSPQAIHRWFDGNTNNPSAENIAVLARYYEADLMWLITGDHIIEGDKIQPHCKHTLNSKINAMLPDGVVAPAIKYIKISISNIEICTVFKDDPFD